MSLYFANLGYKGEDRWMGFHLGRDMKGKLRFKTGMERDLDRKDMAGWIEIKKPLPSESELTLRLVRTEKKRVPLLSVWVMDPETGEWSELQKDIPIPVAKRAGQWKVSIWGRGWKDQDYAFTVDNVRIFERKRR